LLAMPYILTAVNCPPPVTFTGLYSLASGPLTSEAFAIGEGPGVADKLTLGAARRDIDARYGGGYYGVAKGLDLSAGSGLTLNIAAGHAMCDGVVPINAISVGLTDSGRNYVWLSRAGAIVVVFASLNPPAGANVFLGSALTAGGNISSVDQSGVLYAPGGVPWTRTADTGTPGWTAPASLQFVHHTANNVWWWDGVSYSTFMAGDPLPVAHGGTGATTAAIARDNLGVGPQSQLVLQPAASFTFNAVDLNGASEIELRSGGGVGAAFTATLPSSAHSAGDPTSGVVKGSVWSISNSTGFACSLLVNGRTSIVLLPNGGRVSVLYDGTDLVSQSVRSRSALVFPSDANYTPASPNQLADILEVTSSGALGATRDLILGSPVDRTWFVYNATTGGQSIRVIFSSGSGVTIANARGAWVYGNSTNVLRMTGDSVNT